MLLDVSSTLTNPITVFSEIAPAQPMYNGGGGGGSGTVYTGPTYAKAYPASPQGNYNNLYSEDGYN